MEHADGGDTGEHDEGVPCFWGEGGWASFESVCDDVKVLSDRHLPPRSLQEY